MMERTLEISRRSLLKKTFTIGPMVLAATTFMPYDELYAALPSIVKRAKNPKKLTEMERIHVPKLGMPPIAEDGSIVPAYVEVDHPMDPEHYIKSAEILFYQDPVVAKGKFHFTPGNGIPYLSTQIRLGRSGEIVCISECSKHGKWIGVAEVKVTVGGC